MKKLLFVLLLTGIIRHASAQELNGVTFGFGAGYSHTFDKTYDYSLTTDGNYALKQQQLNRNGFVISSVLIVKLTQLNFNTDKGLQLRKARTRKSKDPYNKGQLESTKELGFLDHLTFNLALNLVDVTPDVSFNKNIDGGIGLGYFFNDNFQIAAFFDVSRIRQLRDYVVADYAGKPIPSGTNTVYNALDPSNNDLFFSKTISGISIKAIYSIGNKK